MNNLAYHHQQVNWPAAQQALRDIRMRVFMDEQQVSAQDEWDGLDETAVHFLTHLDGGQAIATARVLVETDTVGKPLYHIGRVAVLKDYRGQGVGRRLMAYVMDWCLHQSPGTRLYLHAQTTRVAFYQYLGFMPRGTEFMDAGIPHITMWYDPSHQEPLIMSQASSISEQLILLENCADFQEHALTLAQGARRHIAILSTDLDFPLYNQDEFVSALSQLVRSSRFSQVQILVKNTKPLIERGHKLARLSQRLTSKVLLRKLTLQPENTDMGFMLRDSNGLLFKNDDLVYRGFANYAAAVEVKRLRETFDYLWQYAEPEADLQQLHI